MNEPIEGLNVEVEFDYKAGKKKMNTILPNVCKDEDYIVQYVGIWKVMYDYVLQTPAKTILEFGTRDGYSTRLFSDALRHTKGDIYTVDLDKPKNDLSAFENVHVITSDIKDLEWSMGVDILYIDDWHNPWHVYSELDRFAKWAKVVMIHDVVIERGNRKSLLMAVESWCCDNMMIYTIYPMNGCGLAVIEVEKSGLFYANEDKSTGGE